MNGTQLPPDLQTDAGAAQRKSALAQALLQQSMAPRQGQMVSGHYVSPGISALITPLAQAYLGKNLQAEADRAQQQTSQAYNQRLAEGLDSYTKRRAGDPGTTLSTLEPDQPGPEPVEGFVQPDPRGAAVRAIASGIGPLQEIGTSDLKALNAPARSVRGATGEKFGHTPVELRKPDGSPVQVLIGDQGTVLPLSEFAPKLRLMNSADRVVNEATGEVVRDLRPQFGKMYREGGDVYQNDLGTGQTRKLDNGPKVNVSVGGAQIVNKGETKFAEALGAGQAKSYLEAQSAARGAYKALGSVAQLRELESKGVTSGKFANAGVALAEVAEAFGVPVDKNRLANDQGFTQQVAKQVADVLTMGGGIGRSMTDADRKAFEASLPSRLLTPAGRKLVYAQLERDAQGDIQHYEGLHSELAQNPVYQGSLGMLTQNPVGTLSGRVKPSGSQAPIPGLPSNKPYPSTPKPPVIKGW